MAKKGVENEKTNKLAYIVTYLFSFLSGAVVYVVARESEKRLKKHAVQAIALGIISFALGFIPFMGSLIGFLVWLYGMYVGLEAYAGRDVKIPVVSDYVK